MDDSERERFLIEVDTLAETLLARAAPVRFAVATAPHELDAIWRLRAGVVVERGWRQLHELPGEIERDEYDDRAVHIAGWDGDTLAGATRLVFPAPGERLPTEAHFDLIAQPAGHVANLDRFIVARRYSDSRHRMLVALAFRSWLELRAHGLHMWIGAVTPGMIRLYRRLDWRVAQVAPGREYWGEQRLPCIFDPFHAFLSRLVKAPIPEEAWSVKRYPAAINESRVTTPE